MKKFLAKIAVLIVSFMPYIALWVLCGCSHLKPSDKPQVPEYLLASCWDGPNANSRMMNTLSPGMSDDKFTEYLNWQKARTLDGYGKATTAHVFLSNRRDGENAGYCIYGNEWDWSVDNSFVTVMASRIKAYRKAGFQVVAWVLADDSSPYAAQAKSNPDKTYADLKAAGLLDDVCMVVLGLEMDEYLSGGEMVKQEQACRKVWDGPIGSHMTSGKVCGIGEFVFYQVSPGKSPSWLASETRRIKASIGSRNLIMFEIERNPAPAKCKAIMDTGAAKGVGNI